jgi:hypothetical protein
MSSLCHAYSTREKFPEIDASWEAALKHILHGNDELATIEDAFFALQWAVSKDKVDADAALEFIKENIESVVFDGAIEAATSLLAVIPGDTRGHDEVTGQIYEHVLEMMADNFTEFIDVTDAFNRVQFGDDDAAREILKNSVQHKLDDLSVAYNDSDIENILDRYDVPYELEMYFINSDDVEWTPSNNPSGTGIDEVDDLFERG